MYDVYVALKDNLTVRPEPVAKVSGAKLISFTFILFSDCLETNNEANVITEDRKRQGGGGDGVFN